MEPTTEPRTGRIVAGGVLAVLALAVLTAGAGLLWAHTTQRDDGWYATSTDVLATDAYAITSDDLELQGSAARGDWTGWQDWATGRVRAALAGDGDDVFVGIARSDDVRRYLAETPHDELVDVDRWTDDVTFRRSDGERAPGRPADEPFWDATAVGPGTQELRWEPESGEWTVVVMRADGQRGFAAEVDAGVRTGVLLPVSIGLLVLGLLLGGASALLLASATRPAGARVRVTHGSPVVLEAELDEPLSRWLWLVKWLLAVPHVVALALLWPVGVVAAVLAGAAVLVTGRYPRPLFDFVVGLLRWSWRVTAYALALTTDRYPPFSLGPEPGYPARLDVAYPERLSRRLVLVKWWLLAIPHYLVVGLVYGSLWQGEPAPWGLVGLLAIVAGVVLLAGGRYPRPAFDVLVGLHRWAYRVAAYALLLRDEYPPFRLDAGGHEPQHDDDEGDRHAVPVDDRRLPGAA